VRGTDGEGALIVHCQHVMTQLKTLHTKTHHLLAAVHLGDSKWGADSLLFDERLALAEMARLVPHAPPCAPVRPRAPPCTPSPGARLPCGRRGARTRLYADRGWWRARPLPRSLQRLPAVLPRRRRLQRDPRVAAARHAGPRPPPPSPPSPPPAHPCTPPHHPLITHSPSPHHSLAPPCTPSPPP
jgi:hypothetical protein